MATRWEGNIGSPLESCFGKDMAVVDQWEFFLQPLLYIDTAPKISVNFKLLNQLQGERNFLLSFLKDSVKCVLNLNNYQL
jgi:hypothetical protein